MTGYGKYDRWEEDNRGQDNTPKPKVRPSLKLILITT